MNESEKLAQKIRENIESNWPVLSEYFANDLPDSLKWKMNYAGFKPHVFTQLSAANKILEVANNAFFFISVQAHCLVMIDYWSDNFQFHGWLGPSKDRNLYSDSELTIAELCSEYRYAA